MSPDVSPASGVPTADGHGAARRLVARLAAAGTTLGTCESLTGGGIAAELTSVPGASAVVRGALVTYASDLKVSLAGVDADRVARQGVVDEDTAREMAAGARGVLGADWVLACTGVAGPDPQDGQPVGTVHLALATPDGVVARRLSLCGDRAAIRRQTVEAALALALETPA